ncbi:hypothetical protein ACFO4E_16015 [Nocardiopsis mangrovi]|uniref:DUF7144 domain-containing protein n=1 Tax=Nocardiopsis mangrovi TaxID=1179818 RepID=A0ABV9DZI3_9ACTN
MKSSKANPWGIFGATILFIVGAINIVQGIVAMFRPEFFVAPNGQMMTMNFPLWGALLVIWGIILAIAGFALLSGQMWARVFAVVIAAINAVLQLAFLALHPVWSVVAIALDIVIIYGMTVGWQHHRAQMGAYDAGRTDAARTPAGRGGEVPSGSGSPESGGSGRAGGESAYAGPTSGERPPESSEGRGRHEGPAS